MSDSKDTNELDSYGVWVKTPPKTVDSSNENNTTENLDEFNLDTELPDFSDLDVVDNSQSMDYDNNDTALSADELSAIAGVTSDLGEEESVQEEKIEETAPAESSESGEEEISLDEFIEGGIFETGPDEDKIKEKEAAGLAHPPAEEENSSETEDVSLDDFGVSADSDDEAVESSQGTDIQEQIISDSTDDDLFNIDLSIDDSNSDETASDSSGFMSEDFTGENSNENVTADDGTESVDLSEFGFDDLNSNDDIPTDSSTETNDTVQEDDAMESVDLSEFGFDDSAEEEASQEENTVTAEESSEETVGINDSEPQNEQEESITFDDAQTDETISLNDETSEILGDDSVNLSSEDDFTVSADDDEKIIESDAVSAATPEQNFTTEEDKDFDVDSLLGNVTDENGNTVSIGNPEENIVKEVADIPEEDSQPQISSESIEDLNDIEEEPIDQELDPSIAAEIPDTFDEETSALFDNEISDTNSLTDEQKTAEFADSISAPILSEMEGEEEKPSTQMTAIFDQIVGELSSLKNEIASLKTDLEKLKNVPYSTDLPTPEASEDTGFFSNTGEDDTIALSTDELDNILNSADITQSDENVNSEDLLGAVDSNIEIPEEDFDSSNDLNMDFSSEESQPMEEPALDDIDYSAATDESDDIITDEESNDDNILVESSSTDLMDESDVINSQEPSLETTEDPFDELTKEDPPISETLTEDKLDYLSETEEPKQEAAISNELTTEIKSVLSYMDQLLENLPEEKIAEFAQSEQFDTYKKLFKELGLA